MPRSSQQSALDASFELQSAPHSYLDDQGVASTDDPNPSSRQHTRTPTPFTPDHSSNSPSPQSAKGDTQSHYDAQYHRPDRAGKSEPEEEDPDAWDVERDDPLAMPSDMRSSHNQHAEHRPRSHSGTHLNGNRTHASYDSPRTSHPGSGSLRRRRSSFKSDEPHSPPADETRKRYTYAAFFLVISLISFTVQTETAVYIQHNLKWNKAYAMLYFTHGSWSMLWFLQLLILRLQSWSTPWSTFWRRHLQILHQTAQMVAQQDTSAPFRHGASAQKSPWPYIAKTVAFVTCALTVAGGSWYVAVDWTTASDLTAIYNCSAFFAYVFSVPLLHEKVRLNKVLAVLVAVAGVLVVAYGDATPAKHGSKSGGGTGGPDSAPDPNDEDDGPVSRVFGNIVIGIGSVLYGLYEVLYKRLACPPDGTSPGRGMIFANFFGTLIGAFTLLVLWIPLPILHYTGIEVFQWPTGEQSWMLGISVFCNAVFSGSFLVLISLTSPVLSSVAALLTIFLVALVDQLLPPPLYSPLSGAAIAGGVLIIVAFLVLSWATYKEMDEEKHKRNQMEEYAAVGGDDDEGSEDGMEELPDPYDARWAQSAKERADSE